MNENFSSRLREARGSMSQTEFCALINVKQGTYSTWELGKYEPPLEMLTKIARVTQMPTDWLLGLSTAPPSQEQTETASKTKTLNCSIGPCQECKKKDAQIERLNRVIDKLTK